MNEELVGMNSHKLLHYFKKKYNNNSKISKKKNCFRLSTYNINSWNNNTKNIIDLIIQSDSDIILLQEVDLYNNYINKLLEIYKYNKFCSSRENELWGNWILSKKEFTMNYDLLEGYRERKKCYFRIVINLKDVNNSIYQIVIYGTHLDVWDQSGTVRIKQLKQIFDRIKIENDKDYIILGDFNSLSQTDYNENEWNNLKKHHNKVGLSSSFHTKEINYIKKRNKNLQDSLELLDRKRNVTVWSMKRVDYIFSTSSLRKIFPIIDSNIIYKTYSDHLLVYSDFQGTLVNNWFIIKRVKKDWNSIGTTFKKYNLKIIDKNIILKHINHVDILWNELFASVLYRFFGVNATTYNLIQLNKNIIVLESPLLLNYKEIKNTIPSDSILEEYSHGFFVDVLLLNYDFLNDICENTGISTTQIIRQDVGGSLLYRALGSKRTEKELMEKYSHRSILGKEVVSGVFKGYCRDIFLDMVLKQQKKVNYIGLRKSFHLLKNIKSKDLDKLEDDLRTTIINSKINVNYKSVGIDILKRVIHLVKKRLKIYSSNNFETYLHDMI